MARDAFDDLASALVGGAQEEYVAELTLRLAKMLEAGVDNPDEFARIARLARADALAVWAEHEGRVSEACRQAFEDALAEEDSLIVEGLEAYRPGAAYDTAYGAAVAAEAARGMGEILRRQNVALADAMADAWYRVTADAVARWESGESRRAVMERACAALADAGLETVDYRSGVRTSVDAAIRRHLVTQWNQASNDLLMRRMDEWGLDLVFTSAHFGARPEHAVWQGKVFSRSGSSDRYPDLVQATGYGTVTGLCGANCRHTMTPYVEGYSKLPDTDWSAQERETGMTSDEYYEATQRQRRYEAAIRRTKREIAVGREMGLDMVDKRVLLGRQQARVRQWCAERGLRRDYGRERAYGVGSQPRALKLTVRENTARDDARRYAVKTQTVESRCYASMVRERFGPCGDMAVEDARRMLRHRAGTAFEDLYAYDLTDGKRLGSVTGAKTRQSVDPSPKLAGRISSAVSAGHEVAMLHNHPGSYVPSAADVLALKRTGARFGVVACHDGSLYVYEIVGEPAPGYRIWYDGSNDSIKDAYELRLRSGEERALRGIESVLGVRIVHLQTRSRGVGKDQAGR